MNLEIACSKFPLVCPYFRKCIIIIIIIFWNDATMELKTYAQVATMKMHMKTLC